MNRWNSLSQMIEHSMKHATCTCSFVNIPNIDIHKIKNGLVQFKRIEVSTNHKTATGENIHVGTILKKKTSISKFHL